MDIRIKKAFTPAFSRLQSCFLPSFLILTFFLLVAMDLQDYPKNTGAPGTETPGIFL